VTHRSERLVHITAPLVTFLPVVKNLMGGPTCLHPRWRIFSFWGLKFEVRSVYVFLKMAHRFEFSCNYSNSGGPVSRASPPQNSNGGNLEINHGNAAENSFMSC